MLTVFPFLINFANRYSVMRMFVEQDRCSVKRCEEYWTYNFSGPIQRNYSFQKCQVKPAS